MGAFGKSGTADIINMPQVLQAKAPKAKGNLLTHLFPTIGGIGGGALGGAAGGAAAGTMVLPGVGTAVGGLLGALLGGAAGGAGGKVLENKVEGEALGNGVGKEALMNGVMGAGPLRLLKGAATAGKTLKAGTGLADALRTGGAIDAKLAAPSMFKTAVANKLDGTAENMAQRGLKMNGSKFNTDFVNQTGEEVGQFARRFNIPHTGIEHASQNVLQPGYAAHAAAVKSIGDIPKTDVLSQIQATIAKELKSPVPATQAFAKSVMAEAKGVLDNLPDVIPATKLNSVKSEIAARVNHGATDTASRDTNNVLNRVSGAFRTTINNAATKNGIKVDPALSKLGYKSTDVGGLGEEVSHLQKFLDQASVKSRVGGGGNPIGLTAAALTGGVGGPAGLAAGAAAQAINSSAGKKGIAKGIDALALRADKTAIKSASPYSMGQVTKRVAPVGLLGALNGQSGSNMPMTANTMIDPSAINIDPSSTFNDQSASTFAQPTNSSPFAPENVEGNIQKMVQSGKTMKEITQYISLVQALQEINPTKAIKPLTGTQAQQATNAQSGLDALSTIQQQLQQDPSIQKKAGLPGGSLTGALTGTGTYKAAINNATDVIGRLRSGGAIGAEEQKNFMRLLPQTFDDDKTVQYKLTQLNNLFQHFANPNPAQPDQVTLGAQ